MKTCFVTNAPAPYREKIHEIIAKRFGTNYHVYYCQQKESNRCWEALLGNYPRTFLKKRVVKYKDRYININLDIWSKLIKHNADIVITTGFNPTFLLAFLWSKAHRKKHITMTDGWLASERKLHFIHRLIRRIVYKYSDAFIGASKHSLDLYRSYGCDNNALFQSHLCADNKYFAKFIHEEKKYDILFSGQMIERKMPLFFCKVAKKIKEKKTECKILVMGSGPIKDDFFRCLDKFRINYHYAGFVQQGDLPRYYASSRVLLFPTQNDSWGVVANEACASAVPVITCGNAGVAYDLIQHGENGFILPLDVEEWADTVVKMLNNPELYDHISKGALSSVQQFDYDIASKGIIEAAEYVYNLR